MTSSTPKVPKPAPPPGLIAVHNSFKALGDDDDADSENEFDLEEFTDEEKEVESWSTVVKKGLKKPPAVQNCKTWHPKVNAGRSQEKQLNVLIGDKPTQELNMHVADNKWLKTDPATGWRRVTAVVDSGASDSVAPPLLAPEVAIKESPGSRRGQTYSGATAGGRDMENLGQKELAMVTREGVETSATWQIVDVNRPLSAVRRMCKQGNRVIFGLYGGVIQNVVTGEEVPFDVEDEVYTMELWLPPCGTDASASGFPRQER